MTTNISELQKELATASAEEIIRMAVATHGNGLMLASSLGAEDQVLTKMLLSVDPNARIFVLDTGRLHQETYETMQKTSQMLTFNYEVYYPQTDMIQEFVGQHGINAFYDLVDHRRQCCSIRKVEPLRRALSTCDAWITGLRRSQSVTRADIHGVEWDDAHDIVKYNPLAAWSNEDVWEYIKKENIPYNPLHDQGYPSIGCAPCTRPITDGEDIRAGRWWWERPEQKECGLHIKDGKIVRAKDVN